MLRRSDLVGRSDELADVRHVLDAIDTLPAAISLVGEPGIGKTTVWQWAVEAARDAGYLPLQSRLAQSEAGLSFTALGDLFAEVFPSVAESLAERQRRAAGAALLVDDFRVEATDPRAIGVAVLSMLRVLAARQPVLLGIDDAHWLDRASADALGFALRRLTNERVVVLTARRTGPRAGGAESAGLLDTYLPTLEVPISGLSLGALHAIVLGRFGRPLPRPKLRRLHELSRGNPFLAVEIVRAAQSGRGDFDAQGYGGAELDHLLGTRLGTLPASTGRLLLVVAAASRPTVGLLEQAIEAEPRRDLEPAVEAGIVEMVGSDVRFSHPLFASAAYGASSPDERRRVHARLAQLVTDADERAHHLALAASEPDERVAAEVERVADQTFRRGAPAAAAELATMAVRLTPADRVAEAQARAAKRAEYLFESGDTESAAAVVQSQIDSAPAGIERARMLALLARIRHFRDDLEAGTALNEEALREARGDDALSASILEGLAWGLLLTRSDLPQAARYARSAVKAAERSGSNVALAESLAARAVTALAIGARSGTQSMERAMELEPALTGLRVLRHPSYAKAYVLTCTDRLDEARAVYAELAMRADAQGDESALPSIYVQLSMAELLAGAWEQAELHAETGAALAEQGGQGPSLAALRSRLALLAAWRGQFATADSMARAALRLAGAPDDTPEHVQTALTRGGEIAAWALGVVALRLGRNAEAVAYLSALADVLLGAGMREPGELRFLPDLVEALLGSDRRDEADRVAAALQDVAAVARRGSALGLASRSRALVELRDGRPEEAFAAAESAVRLLERSQLPLEAARAQLVLGGIQRRSQKRRAARESLTTAATTFEALGAQHWAEQARAELGRVGGRPSSAGGLTPSESRIADLVAEGMANKEVAAAMGITTKTVELHLSRVYSKLGIGSRTELVRHITTRQNAAR